MAQLWEEYDERSCYLYIGYVNEKDVAAAKAAAKALSAGQGKKRQAGQSAGGAGPAGPLVRLVYSRADNTGSQMPNATDTMKNPWAQVRKLRKVAGCFRDFELSAQSCESTPKSDTRKQRKARRLGTGDTTDVLVRFHFDAWHFRHFRMTLVRTLFRPCAARAGDSARRATQ